MHKKALYIAIVGTCALTAHTAAAVQVSGDGLGEVLLFPYYTTRADSAGNAYATLLSVVNATPSAKAVRVRFLEGRNSRDVLDFNLFLSAFDIWTAAVLPDLESGGAKVGSLDRSCMLPPLSLSPAAPFVNFSNATYSGANDDGAGTGLDRAKEGYFEMIEMATFATTSLIGRIVSHVTGTPPCGVPPPGQSTPILEAQVAIDARPPTGGLFGNWTLINVNSGTDYSSNAIALANFYEGGPNYHSPGTSLPNLTQATPALSSVHSPNGALYESLWVPATADAVSAVLMHDGIMNEFGLDPATRSQTDWVLTMPTKRYYTDTGTGGATKLFQHNFNGSAGSCDDLDRILNIYDREERKFDPAFPETFPRYSLCWAANVIRFDWTTTDFVAASNILGSSNGMAADLLPPNAPAGYSLAVLFQNGWLNLTFSADLPGFGNTHRLVNEGATAIGNRSRMTIGNTVTYVGLPVIGFAVTSYRNETLTVGGQNVLSNYGAIFPHKTSTLIQ